MSPIDPSVKRVFYFDFDETLGVVELDEESDRYQRISSSAASDLSVSDTGVVESPPLVKTPAGKEIHAKNVVSFARKKFGELFRKIEEINKKAGEKVIYIHVLTNATYQKEYVEQLLKRWYGDSFELDGFANRHRGVNEEGEVISKGEYMEKDFEEKYRDLKKSHMYLIDDDFGNCYDAIRRDFLAICMGTKNREELEKKDIHRKIRYTKQKEVVYSEINKVIERVEKAISESLENK